MARAPDPLIIRSAAELHTVGNRRSFLRLLGLGGTVVLLPSVFAACDDDDDITAPGGVALDLSTDIGILNYAYALEQLEAAFYTQAVDRFSSAGITNQLERDYLTDIRNHEIAHREFYEAVLGDDAIDALSVDFGNALATRESILLTAQTFEDLGVAAYNGAGKYLDDPDFLAVAGKIVSVEARHASILHALVGGVTTFADWIEDDGLDRALEPSTVLAAIDGFIENDITISAVPQ